MLPLRAYARVWFLAGWDYGGRYDRAGVVCLGADVHPVVHEGGSSHSRANNGKTQGAAVRLHRYLVGGHSRVLNVYYTMFLFFLLV